METATPKLASSIELAAIPSAISLARLHTVKTLQQWQMPPEAIETAKLLVSELATNALPDCYSDGHRPKYAELDDVQRFWLHLCSDSSGTGLLIEVKDSNPRPPALKAATDIEEGGRGLILISFLSRSWGYFYAGAFKTVWCEIDCTSVPLSNSSSLPVTHTL